MGQAVRAPYFVPETIKADILFRNMKKTRNTMAIVLDEYSGTVGIITLNDLIERLVGDLGEDTEEEAAAEPHLEQTGENTWDVFGNVELRDMEPVLDVTWQTEDVDTFTGLVFGQLDRIPEDGKQNIRLELNGLHIHITEVRGHRIVRATVTKPVSAGAEEENP